MLEKIKGWSLGKKIYSALWGAWAIILATLIGLFVGLKDDYTESKPPADGWTLKKTDNADAQVTGITDEATAGAVLKDMQAKTYANFFVKDNSKTVEATVITAIKTAITQANWDKAKIADTDNLAQVIAKVKSLTVEVTNAKTKKTAQATDYATIDKMNTAIWANVVYANLNDARKTKEGLGNTYDLSVIYAKPASATANVNIVPVYAQGKWNGAGTEYTNGSYASGGLFVKDAWNSTLTDHAKSSVNLTAAFGLLALMTLIGAIGTTVHVSIKEKKGGKK